MFFHYHQNNSGGGMDIDDNIHINIIIEAKDNLHADTLAQQIGIYFDGIEKGEDCECCGDRWSRQCSVQDGEDYPNLYGRKVTSYKKELLPFANGKVNILGYIYYLDGRKEVIVE